ncbi:uncharacterized protein LOC106778769 [Vigna radiata var. radiata]|uniref:Uncharacterized protein LOC106778769 n=1 Tax=Vigna radiata var. radiata TaxID=3916 RepID=A0A1S3VVA9_VIGRR|nr:uncharacterized protein LOC106778769 [Vigna radiata var. radiata]
MKPKVITFGFRQNRVSGTATRRSTNIILGKPEWDKSSITKAKISVPQKKPKPIFTTTHDKKITENVNHGVNKKSDTFPSRVAGKTSKTSKKNSLEEGCVSEPKTPAAVAAAAALSHVRTNISTPFRTAQHCSKCRFDRLETSSYWVGQIKMAESVGKHFVASDFFRLALESQAEPIRKLQMELRRYLLRHEYLWEQKEWREVAASYGVTSATHESKNGSHTYQVDET